MELNKCKVGDLVELVTEINSNLELGIDDVMGMTLTKKIIPTKANINPKELAKFIIVSKDDFIYNPRTHGKKIGFGFNDENRRFLISWNNIAFRIKKEKLKEILPSYLWIWLKRDEWDRKAVFNSWGSSTEVFSWNEFCDMDIVFPSITIQQKYADIYIGMLENKKAYERGLNDLKLVCDGYIESLREKSKCPIGDSIVEINNKNTDKSAKKEMGVSINKEFISTKVKSSDLSSQKKVGIKEFAFNTNTSRNSNKISIAINNSNEEYAVSNTYCTFKCKNDILPEYLYLWLSRSEFDRYARFNSWGSARETLGIQDIKEYEISIPSKEIQQDLINILEVYNKRKIINEKMDLLMKTICPILIKGSILDGEMEV